MKHYIKVLRYTDGRPNGIVNHIIWDDEAGTVEGDHYQVPALQEDMKRPMPYILHRRTFQQTLHDVAHNPSDFLVVLATAAGTLQPPKVTLPDSLKGVTPTKPTYYKDFPGYVHRPGMIN